VSKYVSIIRNEKIHTQTEREREREHGRDRERAREVERDQFIGKS
jgi:hypothetical protein